MKVKNLFNVLPHILTIVLFYAVQGQETGEPYLTNPYECT